MKTLILIAALGKRRRPFYKHSQTDLQETFAGAPLPAINKTLRYFRSIGLGGSMAGPIRTLRPAAPSSSNGNGN